MGSEAGLTVETPFLGMQISKVNSSNAVLDTLAAAVCEPLIS